MGRQANAKILEQDLGGFRKFKRVLQLLEGLHGHAVERDKAGNRKLFYDQYLALLLLYYFNPVLTSLRGIQQASALKKVQKKLKCPRASLGSLSDAARVFDARALQEVIGQVVAQLGPIDHRRGYDQVKGILTLVDGTLLPALPKLVQAMWLDDQHKAFKIHTHFEAVKSVPVAARVTAANQGEVKILKQHLSPDRCYVMDRGYYSYSLFREIEQRGSSFVCRGKENIPCLDWEHREVPASAHAAGIMCDQVGCFHSKPARAAGWGDQPLRRIEIVCEPNIQTRKTAEGGPPSSGTVILVTDLMDVPAEVVALIYQHRWQIEVFFRFFKHVLGCRHLISHDTNGIEIQVYVGILACLLIAWWTGKRPTLRTYEMVCFYLMGMADQGELLAHIEGLAAQ